MSQLIYWTGCVVARCVERVLPTPLLMAVVAPLAACAATWDVVGRPQVRRAFDDLPKPLQLELGIRRFATIWMARMRLRAANVIRYWPDRLDEDKWRARCEWVGRDRLWDALNTGRPVVVAILHVGPLMFLGKWLRSQGFRAAAINAAKTPPAYQRWLLALSKVKYDLQDMPTDFHPRELRQARRFLKAEHVLVVAIDGAFGHKIDVDCRGVRMRMASGALRMAANSDAIILPCVLATDRLLRFTIEFGEPVSDALTRDPSYHLEAGRHLLGAFLPMVQNRAAQFCPSHLRRYHRDSADQIRLWSSQPAMS